MDDCIPHCMQRRGEDSVSGNCNGTQESSSSLRCYCFNNNIGKWMDVRQRPLLSMSWSSPGGNDTLLTPQVVQICMQCRYQQFASCTAKETMQRSCRSTVEVAMTAVRQHCNMQRRRTCAVFCRRMCRTCMLNGQDEDAINVRRSVWTASGVLC